MLQPSAQVYDGVRNRQAIVKNYGKHEMVFRAGDPANQIYEVSKGSLFITKLLDDGRRQVVDLVRAGDICGFADGPEHNSDCEALEATTLTVRERSELARSPQLQDRMLRALERRVCALHEHALALGRKTASERVAALLTQMSLPAGSEHCPRQALDADTAMIRTPMTRSEMADYLGLTLETVCRTLSDLERRNLIEVGQARGEVQIWNVCRLCRAGKTDVCANN